MPEVHYIGLSQKKGELIEDHVLEENERKIPEFLLERSKEFKTQLLGLLGNMEINQSKVVDSGAVLDEEIAETGAEIIDDHSSDLALIEELRQRINRREKDGFNSTVIHSRDDNPKEQLNHKTTENKRVPVVVGEMKEEVFEKNGKFEIHPKMQNRSQKIPDIEDQGLKTQPDKYSKNPDTKRALITVIRKPTVVILS